MTGAQGAEADAGHAATVQRLLERNETLRDVLEGARELDLPDWYVTAGAIFQTVWNGRTGRPPTWGIRDYDVLYHDAEDLGWGAEDVAIRRAAAAFGALSATVEVRNEARVHLWYEDKFGVSCPPYPRDVYETKAARWKATWPELVVLRW